MNWNTENPMVRDELWGRARGINYDEDCEKLFRVGIEIDTRRLKVAEENALLTELDNFHVKDNDYIDTWLQIEVEQMPECEIEGKDEEEYISGKVLMFGRVLENDYDDLTEILNSYNVDWRE